MRKLFKSLPVMGAIRSRSGKILDATDRLLESAGLTRRQAIGKHVTAVFGSHVRVWLAADREALRARHAIERLEYSERSGRWWRSHHVPQSGAVLWVGEDATDKVQLAALMTMTKLPSKGRVFRVGLKREQPFVDAIVAGWSPLEIERGVGMSFDEIASGCIRLLQL